MPISSPASPLVINHQSPVDLMLKPKQVYNQEDHVAWVMHRNTLAAVRKLVNTTGQPIWTPRMASGNPSSLLGYPVFTCDAMPTIAADAHVVAFGAWSRGYQLADRIGMLITVDEIAAPEFTTFYVRSRRGGTVLNNNALKLLKFSES